MKYRKKPVVIEAHLWDGDWEEIASWASNVSDGNGTGLNYSRTPTGNTLHIYTLEGRMHVSLGDYVICGVNGEFYPCKPDIFAKTYEPEVPTSKRDSE